MKGLDNAPSLLCDIPFSKTFNNSEDVWIWYGEVVS